MDETANLKLPYILAAQSQKHVTHNEALRALDAIVQLAVLDKDLSTPPGSPDDGDRYIVSASPTGAWAGHATHVAAWQDGTWAFYAPVAGWLAWVDDESQSYLFSGGGWIPAPGGGGAALVPKGAWSSATTYTTGDLVEHGGYAFLSNIDDNLDHEPDAVTPGSTGEWTYFAVVTGGGGGGGDVNPVPLVGVNATANTTNRLSVASPASLFSHEGQGHQIKINKATAGDTGSVLFQTGFSGRAEFGLAGDDDFHVKVSSDGTTWREALIIDRSTGAVRGKTPGPPPGGRLSLASGTPVTTGASTSTTIYYTPHVSRIVPLYDGAGFIVADIGGQLSQATTDTTKSPAAVANTSNYDLFVWDDGGTVRLSRGPAWTSATARGTGSGTTELERVQGILLNKHAITNGPAAQRGTYVGTVRSNGSAQIVDSPTHRFVWNMYNRVVRPMLRQETTDTWTYSTTGTMRQANDNAANQLAFVRGLDEDGVQATAIGNCTLAGSASSGAMMTGIGIDSTTVNSALSGPVSCTNGINSSPAAAWSGLPGTGYHELVWLEYVFSTGGGTVTWRGDLGGTAFNTGIAASVMG